MMVVEQSKKHSSTMNYVFSTKSHKIIKHIHISIQSMLYYLRKWKSSFQIYYFWSLEHFISTDSVGGCYFMSTQEQYYTRRFTRRHPGLFIILLDQSGSMSENVEGHVGS